MRLTGKKRFRVDKKGRLILQVQYSYLGMGIYSSTEYVWRDAKVEDIAKDMNIDMKGIVVWQI